MVTIIPQLQTFFMQVIHTIFGSIYKGDNFLISLYLLAEQCQTAKVIDFGINIGSSCMLLQGNAQFTHDADNYVVQKIYRRTKMC